MLKHFDLHYCLKSPVSRLFTQSFIQAQIKENIKVLCHWPLCGEFTNDRWNPRTNGQKCGKCFHLMKSSCYLPSFFLCFALKTNTFLNPSFHLMPYPIQTWNPSIIPHISDMHAGNTNTCQTDFLGLSLMHGCGAVIVHHKNHSTPAKQYTVLIMPMKGNDQGSRIHLKDLICLHL